MIVLLSGCGSPPQQTFFLNTATSDPPSLNIAMSDFSQNLFRLILAEGEENPVISPFSVYYALAMAAIDAQGETLQEFTNVLGMPSYLLASQLAELALCLSEAGGNTQLDLAYSIWFTDETSVLLESSLQLNAGWSSAFRPMLTTYCIFYLASGEGIEVPFLKDTSRFWEPARLYATDYHEAVMLPYDCERLGLVMIRPTNGVTIRDFVLTTNLMDIIVNLEEPDYYFGGLVSWQVPILNVSFEATMGDMLKTLGLELAFDKHYADFSMVEESVVFISDVKHKGVIEVNQQGSTSTSLMTGRFILDMAKKLPIRTFDSPFMYLVYDFYTGTILLMGVVDNPHI